jgi:4-aminobutyrate aminotransferase/(S)-3-amino-2-methylpropionate transaminase
MNDLRNSLPFVKGELPGENAKAVMERRKNAVPDAVRMLYPVVINRAEGAIIEDVDGNRFLDFVGGVGVMNVGYSQPEIIEAVRTQSEKYFHSMMNITTHEGYIRLAERLNKIAPVKQEKRRTCFFNSGAEAVENAVKIARSSTGRPNIIVFSGAFHGRTLLAAAMTSKKAYYHGMGAFPDGVYRAEYPYLYRAPTGFSEDEATHYYIKRLEAVFEECSPPEYIAAIIAEPVQGEGGFVPAPKAWVQAVREICDRYGILLCADEVQTGFARSGRMFVSDYWREWGAPPDILIMAKSIAAGLPLSGVTCGETISKKITPGVIGTTYGGNALSCAAANAVLDFIETNNLPERAEKISEIVRSEYAAWQAEIPEIGDIRGIGCMLGMELVHPDKSPYPELVRRTVDIAVKNGLIIESAGTYGNVIRFLAPLVISDEQLSCGLVILKGALLEARGAE